MSTRFPTYLAAALLAGAPACADEPPPPETIKPFSAEANYMSLEGYRRWRKYLETGQWRSLPASTARRPVIAVAIPDVSDPFYVDKRTTLRDGTVTIDLGDINGFLRTGAPIADAVLATSVAAYPKATTFVLLWSHTLSTSIAVEGTPFEPVRRHHRLVYSRGAGRLEVHNSAVRGTWGAPVYVGEAISEQVLQEKVRRNALDALQNLFAP